jgi:hypothetical protein
MLYQDIQLPKILFCPSLQPLLMILGLLLRNKLIRRQLRLRNSQIDGIPEPRPQNQAQ